MRLGDTDTSPILLKWFSEPDTEPKFASEPGSAEPLSPNLLTLDPRRNSIWPGTNDNDSRKCIKYINLDRDPYLHLDPKSYL